MQLLIKAVTITRRHHDEARFINDRKMVSKAKIKFIKSLQVKKYRKQEQSFVVEGAKSVSELLDSDFEVTWLAASESFIHVNEKRIQKKNIEVVAASERELEHLGTFQTNDAAVAIAKLS